MKTIRFSSPKISESFLTFFPILFFLSTAPTAKPAISNSSFLYIPGISAVSPPTSEQPASEQAWLMLLIKSRNILSFIFDVDI